MPCISASFLIVLLCLIKPGALPQDLCHITMPIAMHLLVKRMAMVGRRTWSRICTGYTGDAECFSYLVLGRKGLVGRWI